MSSETQERVEIVRVYSQNVYKNYAFLSLLLEDLRDSYDIIFVQEPPWVTLRHTVSMTDREGAPMTGSPTHPSWLPVVPREAEVKRPRVLAYVSARLTHMRPKLRTDVLSHPDIILLTLWGPAGPINLVNVYSGSNGTAIKFLDSPGLELPKLGYMGGDFNCHSPLWDLTRRGNPSTLANCLDSLVLKLGLKVRFGPRRGPTHFPANKRGRPSVINLVFLPLGDTESSVDMGFQGPSDHRPLLTTIPLLLDLGIAKLSIKEGSEGEEEFLRLVPDGIAALTPPSGDAAVGMVVTAIAGVVASAWSAKATDSRVSRRSKSWWTADCTHAKRIAKKVNTKDNWLALKKATMHAKRDFFDEKTCQISEKTRRPWDLMNWVGPRKMAPIEVLNFEGSPCLTRESAWNALHSSFTSASGRPIELDAFGTSMPPRTSGVLGPASGREPGQA